MKLITYYTPSHRILVQHLLASKLEEYTVHAFEGQQLGPGHYSGPGFRETTLDKLRVIRREATEDFVFTDADVIFLRPSLTQILAESEGYDCVFQRDHESCCTGLFFMRSNPATLQLLDDAISALSQTTNRRDNDQTVINALLPTSGVRYTLLSDLFANPCTLYGIGEARFNKVRPVSTKNMLVFHANWLVGTTSKLRQLDIVERAYRSNV